MIKCTDCQEEKEDSSFSFKDGRIMRCGRCYQCDRKHINKIKKKSREKHITKAKKSRNEYRLRNKDKINRNKKEWRDKNLEKQKEKEKEWARKNAKKRNSYVKKWINKSPENKQRRKDIALKYYRKIKEECGELYLLTRMRKIFRRICNGQKSKKSFEYIGVSSIEDFMLKMSQKTDNPNWLQDGYEIDHIWQINWVSDYCNLNRVNRETLYGIVHSHRNVRPLKECENRERSQYDFSPLLKEDYPIYEQFLDERIRIGLKFYWENPQLFSGQPLKRGSDEEKMIIDHILSTLLKHS